MSILDDKEHPVISLCMPTNGVIEWVFPALDSIYAQDVDPDLYEVIVTDNGDNEEFRQRMEDYGKTHANLVYRKTQAVLFHNQLEALKLGKGDFLKFVNHREVMVPGALGGMIDFIEACRKEKPAIYFCNGVMNQDYRFGSFDEYVRQLGRFASWTTGVGIWREDYERRVDSLHIDSISPHSCILFAERGKKEYVINNLHFSEEITKDHSKKGRYDLFKAFALEEITITQNLYIDGDISADTLKHVIRDYRKFVSELYWDFCICKKPCSYQLDGFHDAVGIYFSKGSVIVGAYLVGLKRVVKKVIRRG